MSFTIKYLTKDLKETTKGFASLKDFEVSPLLVSQTIRSEQLNLRAGNAHTKDRGEVRGGGKKPWKQKGTGRARHGSRRSPIWVGGGVTHGPTNEVNWHSKINKSARLATLKAILKDKLSKGKVLLIADKADFSKTKSVVDLLSVVAEQLKSKPKSFGLLYTSEEKPMTVGFRNTEASCINSTNLKLNQLLAKEYLILTPKSLEVLEAKITK